MFKVFVNYPSYEEEYEIAERTTGGKRATLASALESAEILMLQDVVRRVPVAPSVIHYTLELVRLTRPTQSPLVGAGPRRDGEAEPANPHALINRLVTFGAGPRAVQFLLVGAKARAVIHGRKFASIDDVRALAHAVLRHRLVTNYAAEAEGYTPDAIVEYLLDAMPARGASESSDAGYEKVFGS